MSPRHGRRRAVNCTCDSRLSCRACFAEAGPTLGMTSEEYTAWKAEQGDPAAINALQLRKRRNAAAMEVQL